MWTYTQKSKNGCTFMVGNVSPYDKRCQFYELTLFYASPSHRKRNEVDFIMNKMKKLGLNRSFMITSIECLDYRDRFSVKIECIIDRSRS